MEITRWSVDSAAVPAELPLPLCPGGAALVSPRCGDMVRAGAGCRWGWALSLGFCMWGPGASLSAEKAGPGGNWELPHATSAPSPSPPGTGCAGTPHRDTTQGHHTGLDLWGLGLHPGSVLVHLAAISLSLVWLPLQAAASWGAPSELAAVESSKAVDPGKKSPAIPFFCFAAWRENKRLCESAQVEIAKFQRTLCKSFSTVFQPCYRVPLSHRFHFQSWFNSFARFCCFNAAQWIIFLGSRMKDD